MIGHVLIVDPVVTNRIVMQARLAAAHYGVTCCETLDAAVATMPDIQPAFVFINADLGLQALKQLRTSVDETPKGIYVPIVSIGNSTHGHTLPDIIAHGGQDLMPWPVNTDLMRARLRSLMRQMQFLKDLSARGEGMPVVSDPVSQIMPPKPIMIVAPTLAKATTWATKIRKHMPTHSILASSHTSVLDPHRRGVNGTVYMLVSDPTPETDNILHILSTLKTRTNGASAHYLAALQDGASLQAAAALDMGAADTVFIDSGVRDIAARLAALAALSTEISNLNAVIEDSLRLSLIDPLTGLHNRRYSDHNLARMAGEAQVNGHPLALMIFDIDHFKRVNDVHGHLTGDHVLTRIAETLRSHLNGSGLLARIGGEEFLAVLSGTTSQDAIKLANDVLGAIEQLEFSGQNDNVPFKVTLSAGVSISDGTQSPRSMIEQADGALYRAKADGRNRARLSQTKIAA